MQCATTAENKLLQYNNTCALKEFLLSKVNTKVYACKEPVQQLVYALIKKVYKPRFTEVIPVFDNVMHFIQKQSPYTPWQYKCSHNEKKHIECEMSPQC